MSSALNDTAGFEGLNFPKLAFNLIQESVIITDVTERVLMINSSALELVGYKNNPELVYDLHWSKSITILAHENDQYLSASLLSILNGNSNIILRDNARLISRQGVVFNIAGNISKILDAGVHVGYVFSFRDVTETRCALEDVSWKAKHDALTGLPNRTFLNDAFDSLMSRAKRNERLMAVCMLDLDGFKPVNDTYGHKVGDIVLIEVAVRLMQIVRAEDVAARLGGDEFVLLLNDLRDIDELMGILNRIVNDISEPYLIGKESVKISVSVGVTTYPKDDVDKDALLRHADQAMYQAKQFGRNQFCLFDSAFNIENKAVYTLGGEVRNALKNNQFVLHYQPKVDMRHGFVYGAEGLIRWQHPQRGLLAPAEFILKISDKKLLRDIGIWVINTALNQLDEWCKQGRSLTISINISPSHLEDGNFYNDLHECLEAHPDVPAHFLEIEILETGELKDLQQIEKLINDCKTLGVVFSFDDFGTGYASLSYLKQLPVKTIKIEKRFIEDLITNKDSACVVAAIINMGELFNRNVIAEGVETAEQGSMLLRLGCDHAQGYFISRALPPNQVLSWIDNYKPNQAWMSFNDAHTTNVEFL